MANLDITVTLTEEQADAALADARFLFPDATVPELRSILTDAATHGPGVYAVIGEWRMARVRQEENTNRRTEQEAFEQMFPPGPDPLTDPPEPEPRG